MTNIEKLGKVAKLQPHVTHASTFPRQQSNREVYLADIS